MSLKLYSYNESGNSYKVRLLAALLKVDLEIVELDYFSDEQHSEKFLKLILKAKCQH